MTNSPGIYACIALFCPSAWLAGCKAKKDACADDALWLVSSVVQYIRETGEFGFLDETVTYADGGEGSVYEHLRRILDFSARQVGQNGICKGLRADWNDCLNLGGGESAMVSFLHLWALNNFCELADYLGRAEDATYYRKVSEKVKRACRDVLWDGKWFLRGITADNRKIGTQTDTEGRVHMESNTWAVISSAASFLPWTAWTNTCILNTVSCSTPPATQSPTTASAL